MKHFIKLSLLPILLSSVIYSTNTPWNIHNPEFQYKYSKKTSSEYDYTNISKYLEGYSLPLSSSGKVYAETFTNTYDYKFNNDEKVDTLIINSLGFMGNQTITYTFEYDENNNIVKKSTFLKANEEYERNIITYNNDLMVEIISQRTPWNSSDLESYAKTTYIYDLENNHIETIFSLWYSEMSNWIDSAKSEPTYNSDGNLEKEAFSENMGSYWANTKRVSYTYNTDKTLKKEIVEKPKSSRRAPAPIWEVVSTTTYEYPQGVSAKPFLKLNNSASCKINVSSKTVAFQLPNSGNISLKITSLNGKEIASISKSNSNNIKWNYNNTAISSGQYLYQLKNSSTSFTGKLLIQK